VTSNPLGEFGLTTSTEDAFWTSVIGAKSRIGS
jgi:hypothetical protein